MTDSLNQINITPLTEKNKAAFYQLVNEYLPDSDPARLQEYNPLFPKAFLVMLENGKVIGVAFGWHRKLQFPEDDSFVLNGIAVRQDRQKHGYGKQLLQTFELAAKEYGASTVSLGSAGGYVEKFYIDCGYSPTEYKIWENGTPVLKKSFTSMKEYETYSRGNEDGFVVMKKEL